MEAAIAWFDRHGAKAVLIGRLMPGVRTLISVPAGLAEMSFVKFLTLSAIGSLVWILFLIIVGMVLHDNWRRIADVIGPLGTILVLLLVLGVVAWIGWRRLTDRRRAADQGEDRA